MARARAHRDGSAKNDGGVLPEIVVFMCFTLGFGLILALGSGYVGAAMANNRSCNPSAWFLICAFAPIIGHVALAQTPSTRPARHGGISVDRDVASEEFADGDASESMTEVDGGDGEIADEAAALALARARWMISRGMPE